MSGNKGKSAGRRSDGRLLPGHKIGPRFRKGQTGNPKGRPPSFKNLVKLAQENAEAFLVSLIRVAVRGRSEPARVKAAQYLIEFAYPQAKRVEILAPNGGPIATDNVNRRARQLTTKERRARVAALIGKALSPVTGAAPKPEAGNAADMNDPPVKDGAE